jgi:two-component system sensor histidine kinase MprB
MSLRVRLAAVVAAAFAVVVIGCVYAAHVSTSRELRAETDRFLAQRSHDPRIAFGLNRPSPLGPADGPRPRFAEPDALAQLVDRDGGVVAAADPALPVDDRDRSLAAQGGPRRFRTVAIDGASYRVLTVPVSGGAAQIARRVKETDDVLSTLDVRLTLVAVAGTLVAALLAWIIASRIVRPVERLTSATEEVARTQDLTSSIAVDRHDELGRLASSFNTMLEALRTSREQQKRLVMDASHELRTPLTALRTNIEVLRRTEGLNPAQHEELLAAVQIELTELTDLVTELVDLATDARAEEPEEQADIGALAERVVARFRRRTGREITFVTDDAATAVVRVSAVERALANLLENACKFSTPPAPIDVRVAGSEIEVLDRGPGISDDDRAHVFDRFYRAPAARTMPGSGLGLAIVEQIVELQGGSIELVARAGGGTVARLTLPAVSS